MKTQMNQIITIVSFFSLSIVTTIAISWGMSQVVYEEVADQEPLHNKFLIRVHSKTNIDLSKSLRMLIPRSAPSTKG